LKNCEAKDSLKQAEHKYESKDKLEDIEKEDVRNDEASNTLEISENTENVINTHDNLHSSGTGKQRGVHQLFIYDDSKFMIQLGGNIVQYSHRVWATHEISQAD
jgi:hypothetical protein